MQKENIGFVEYLAILLDQINQSKKVYSEFFSMHTMNFANEEKPTGRQMRDNYFFHIKEELLNCLQKDGNIRNGVFNEIITKEAFAHHVFTLFLSVLPEDTKKDKALLEMLRIYLY